MAGQEGRRDLERGAGVGGGEVGPNGVACSGGLRDGSLAKAGVARGRRWCLVIVTASADDSGDGEGMWQKKGGGERRERWEGRWVTGGGGGNRARKRWGADRVSCFEGGRTETELNDRVDPVEGLGT